MKKTSLLVLFFILLVFACSDGEDGSPLQDVLHDVLGDVSLTDITAGSEDYAFIVNAAPDYKSATYSVMKIADRSVSKDKDVIHTDAVAKVFNNIVYVVNRMGADNITVIDPKKNFSIIKQFSVGANTNPQDVAIIDNKMFVTKQLSNYIDIYETTNYSKIGSIDISKYADADGNAEPQDMIIYNGKLYLTVLRLDKKNAFAPTDKSYLLVINTSDLKVEKEIVLGATNPFAGILLDERNERIVIGETGKFGETDGRVEFFSIKDGIITPQNIPESKWGGDLNRIAFVKNKVFAVISDANFNTSLKVYDLANATLKPVYETTGFSLAGISIFSEVELFLCDRDLKKPGIRIFDIESLTQKTSEPIDTGLPPVSLVFFKM